MSAKREAKHVLAKLSTLQMGLDKIDIKMKDEPARWKWATAFREEIEEVKNTKWEEDDKAFMEKLKVAVLSPSYMKDLKKEMGENFIRKLNMINTVVGAYVSKQSKLVEKIMRMAEQNDQTTEVDGQIAAKRRPRPRPSKDCREQ